MGKAISKSLKLHHNALYGDHEIQESEGGEADLHQYFTRCAKNPDHQNFIPVDTFSVEHLPKGFQDNDLHELIKLVADLTVRVDVRMTSPHRPKFWPGTEKPRRLKCWPGRKVLYPFYDRRGESILKFGTGRVTTVGKFTDGQDDNGQRQLYNYTKCWCTKCKHSGDPRSVWWEFDVITAAHVVFDDIEAGHTSVRLFYDRDVGTVDTHNMVSDCKIYNKNTEGDKCFFKCVTCDDKFVDKLYRSYRDYPDAWNKVYEKFKSSRDIHRMTFIVSHPHGCFKQVSVGQWEKWWRLDKYSEKCTYTACTCPGSSGAFVFCVGFEDGISNVDIVHSGAYKPGLNISSSCLALSF